MNTPALKVNKLSVWLETPNGRKQLVDSISFSVDAGRTIGLVGESGCGKTMTAMAIMGLLGGQAIKTSSDGIEINGKDISRLSNSQERAVLGRDISMIFQKPATAFDPVFTIGHQIAAVIKRHQEGSKNQSHQTVLDALENVGFNDPQHIAASYPHQLSGGMLQLAMIAMAMICKPSIIIADEPTTALDASTRALILEQLEKLQKATNTAILLISHDLSVIRHSCVDVMVMYCGRIVEIAKRKNLFSHARHPYSAGLLACVPRISSGPAIAIQSIPGQVPSTFNLPRGCHFAPRCDRAEERCNQSVPALDSEGRSSVACFRPLS